MRRLLEIYRGIRGNWVFYLIATLQITVCLALGNLVLGNLRSIEHADALYAYLFERMVVPVFDRLEGTEEAYYFSQPNTQNILQLYLQALEKSKEYPYYILGKQPLYEDEGTYPAPFHYGNGSQGLWGHQVNEPLMSAYPLELVEGTGFKSEDYIFHEGKPVPIILGFEYLPYFDVGDNLQMEYMGLRLDFKVCGIAAQNSFFPLDVLTPFVNEDFYIIMPSLRFENPPKDNEEDRFQKGVCLEKLSGYFQLFTKDDFPLLLSYFDDITSRYNITYLQFGYYENDELSLLRLSSYTQMRIIYFLTALVLVFTFITWLVVVRFSVHRSTQRFAVLQFNGARRIHIIAYVAGEVLTVFVLASFLSWLFTCLFFHNIVSLSLPWILVSLCVSLVSVIPALTQYFRLKLINAVLEVY